jgi:uncharacterized protein YdeI (YjbR/CyaY-like superfamily)
MGTKDPRIDAYIAKSADFAQPLLAHLRKLVHSACPEVEETIKWGFPHFMYRGMLCSMASFKEHCAFGFWHPLVRDSAKKDAKSSESMGQFGRITSRADLPNDATIKRLVRHAMQLNEDGVKRPAKPKPVRPKTVAVPADLTAALKRNKAAQSAFDAFSPSNKREYVEWITEAKRAETRAQRLETAIAWIAEGKSRNWKYEKKT